MAADDEMTWRYKHLDPLLLKPRVPLWMVRTAEAMAIVSWDGANIKAVSVSATVRAELTTNSGYLVTGRYRY